MLLWKGPPGGVPSLVIITKLICLSIIILLALGFEYCFFILYIYYYCYYLQSVVERSRNHRYSYRWLSGAEATVAAIGG